VSAVDLAIGAVAAAIAVFAGFQVASAIEDAVPEDRWFPGITVPGITTPQGTVPGLTTPEQPVPSRPARPASPSRALDPPLYRAATFREVLRRVRSAGGGRVSSLRVDADDVVALAQGRGRRVLFVVRAGGFQRTVTTRLPGGGPPAFALSRVRPGVPAALVRRVARRARVGPDQVDYLVATRSPVENQPYWLVFVRGGRGFYRAGMDGTGLRRLG
jgi:hypothetical protein